MEPLPTPRRFLETLISSLPESIPPENNPAPPNNPSTNPLQSLDQAHRNILITIHVLYPSILLHSLDLLDRGLVTKVTQSEETPAVLPTTTAPHEAREEPRKRENSIYHVRSAQTPRAFNPRQSTNRASPKAYIVRLGAWHCSCAAFAFSAFPQTSSLFAPRGDDVVMNQGENGEVGGMSFDGMDQSDGKDGGVAMCKHLLACLLMERWGGVLGTYLKEMKVGRNEMAGLCAEA